MYLDFFGLEREPFHITPDPDFLFPSPSHKEAFATVMYGVQQQKGFVVVTGEVGTGKTTILRAYLQKLKGSDIQPIYVFDPHLEFDELLEAILTELGAPPDSGATQFARLQWLRHYLIDAYSAGRSVVLIIDEAQNMPVGTLEQLRVLTNLETTKDKLLQVLLVGQPELEEKLALHQLRQLNQRVAVRATLRALGDEEATDYVKHRIRQAGGTPETVFTPAALKAIVSSAKGNPRVLNITCDNVLINAFGAQECPVSTKIVRDVVRTLQPASKPKPLPWRQYAPVAAAAGLLLVGGAGLFMVRPQGGGVPVVSTADPAASSAPASAAPATVAPVVPIEAPESQQPTPEPAKPEAAFDTDQLALKRMLEREREVEREAGVAPKGNTAPKPEEMITTPEVNATDAAPVVSNDVTVAVISEKNVSAPAPEVKVETEAIVEEATATATAPELMLEAEVTPEPAPADAPENEVPASEMPAEPKPELAEESDATPAVEPVEKVVASAQPVSPGTPLEQSMPTPPVEELEVESIPKVEAVPSAEALRDQVEPARKPSPKVEQITLDGALAREVVKGDKLIVLVKKIYGRSDAEIIELVQRANPGLTDPNRILAGEDLVFPKLEEIAEPAAAGENTPAPSN